MSDQARDEIRAMIKEYPSVEFIYKWSMYKRGPSMLSEPGKAIEIDFVDRANDGVHPGPKTNIKVAQWVSDQLKLLNVVNSI